MTVQATPSSAYSLQLTSTRSSMYLSYVSYILANNYYRFTAFIESILMRLALRLVLRVELGKSLVCNGIPLLQIHPLSTVSIGNNVVLTSRVFNNSIGVGHPVIIKVFPNAFLRVGDRVGMSSVRISCSHSISIGDDVLIGADTLITDSDAHPLNKCDRLNPLMIKSKPVIICPNVFIGAKCIILKGSWIGDGAVIGAGSVVTGKIAPNCVYAGNPAKFVKKLAQ